MPREGVPYPERVLCSLKNTIAMIEQKLGLKIEKINGVGPDPSGNVTIVSDDAALTIEEDAAQHQVTIGLNRAELPNAAVTSVNGETGAVVLDASEIPYNDPDGYTDDVDEKLNVLTGVQNALQLGINQERTRAQNAESGLQNNINAEALTRSSDDANLQGQINALPTDADVAQAVQDGLDSYASMVRTSGNQMISGIKNINSFFNYGVRLTGTNVYELFRMDLANDVQVYYTAFTRYGAGLGKLTITLDADNNIASMTTDKVITSASNDGITTFYAYKDGSQLVVCTGNSASYNNYLAITINSLMSGAGVPRNANTSYIGTARTASAVSAKVLQ